MPAATHAHQTAPLRTGGLLRFWRCFVPHLALAPLLFFTAVTFLHELAHALAALLVGGTVTEFSFLPRGDTLGHMRWVPPPGATWLDGALVSVAPYLMWSTLALVVIVVACWRRRRPLHWITASTLFVWGYAVPVGDIALNLFSGHGDLAIGGVEGLVAQGVGAHLLLAAYLVGHAVQRRLFGERAVGFGGYLLSTLVLGAGFGLSAAVGLVLLGALS
jgi:hypothetical protein